MIAKNIIYVALFASLTASLAIFPPIIIPLINVPITAQSFGPMIAGALLGARRGSLALVLFLALVIVGFPLLPGGRGGFSALLGVTGGFVLSWPVAALVIGYLVDSSVKPISLQKLLIFIVFGGIGIVYLIGLPWVILVGNFSFWQALIGVLVFIPGDIIKAILAATITYQINKVHPL